MLYKQRGTGCCFEKVIVWLSESFSVILSVRRWLLIFMLIVCLNNIPQFKILPVFCRGCHVSSGGMDPWHCPIEEFPTTGGMDPWHCPTEEFPTKFNKYKRLKEREKLREAARLAVGTTQSDPQGYVVKFFLIFLSGCQVLSIHLEPKFCIGGNLFLLQKFTIKICR